MENPDFIFITEVLPKILSDVSCSSVLYQLDGYCTFPSKDSGRGVIIYAKSDMNVSPNVHLNSIYDDASWCNWIVDNQTIILGVIYRSPSSHDSYVTVNRLLTEATNSGNRLLIAGDFNMKDIDWTQYTTCHSETHHEHKFIECIQDNFLFQHISEVTRVRDNQSSNILDLVLTNDEHDVAEISILPSLGVSDHVTILFSYLCSFKEYHTGVPTLKYGRCDYKAFSDEWSDIDWNEEFNDCDINDMWEIFASRYEDSVAKHVPKVIPKKGCKPKPLWITGDALKCIKDKKHAWSRYRATRCPADFAIYSRIRNATTESIRTAKREYEKKIAAKAKTESKHFWKYVKSKIKTVSNVSNLVKDDGSVTKTEQEKAEVLNSFFASVFTRENISNVPDLPDRIFDVPLDNVQLNLDCVVKILLGLDGGKSMGPDELNPLLLKTMAQVFAIPLLLIFQKSLDCGKIPKVWKDARVTPLFKKGTKSSPGNYRPVSLTSIVCKCLEKLIRAAVIDHLTKNNLISSAQFGFRSGRSCVLQLLDVMEDWSTFIEENDSWDTVYLDFAKAFDSVPHKRLLHKLSSYGIKGTLLLWISDFLLGRRQYVAVKGKHSSWQDVLSGVPQGSVLGPILFIIYINDLPEVVNSTVKIFADDTKLYSKDSDYNIIQQDLDSLCSWADLWQLRFNVSKCKAIHYGRDNQEHMYSMNSVNLEIVSEEKDLGITFQQNLKFSSHIASKVNKANSMLSLIVRSFDYIEKDTFLMLYKAMVRPHIEYGNTIWYPFLRKDIISVEKVQKRATKTVPQLKNLEYTDRLKELKLPTLAHRRRRGDMIQTFKIIRGIEDIPSDRFFTICHSRTRGHEYKLAKPRCTTSFRLQQFSQRIINDWNSLPKYVVNAKDVNDFKSKIDQYWNHDTIYQF
ncbi:MAG: reverse transcriptase family protein [Sedimenticola sp.]